MTDAKNTCDADITDGIAPNSSFLRMCERNGMPRHELRLSVGYGLHAHANLASGWTNGKRVPVQSIGNYTVNVIDADHWQGSMAIMLRSTSSACRALSLNGV